MPIVKSVSSTRVAPRLSAIPPLCVIDPANVFAFTVPPVIGNASELEPIGAAAIPRLCSAAPAPASSATVVVPDASETVSGVARTVTLPSSSPARNRCVEKVALSALAAAPVRDTRTRVMRVSRPTRVMRARLVSTFRSVTRDLPTCALSVDLRASLIRKDRALSDLPPAENFSPPECSIVPAAPSSDPPVIGKDTFPRAGEIGRTRTPFALSVRATALSNFRVVVPDASGV